MSHPHLWRPEQDALIVAMRARGETWTAMVSALKVSRSSVINRAIKIGCLMPGTAVAQAPVPAARKESLRPGEAWAILTAGTLLDGEAYCP